MGAGAKTVLTVLQVIESPARLLLSKLVRASRRVFRCARNSSMPRAPIDTLWAVKQPPASIFGQTAVK